MSSWHNCMYVQVKIKEGNIYHFEWCKWRCPLRVGARTSRPAQASQRLRSHRKSACKRGIVGAERGQVSAWGPNESRSTGHRGSARVGDRYLVTPRVGWRGNAAFARGQRGILLNSTGTPMHIWISTTRLRTCAQGREEGKNKSLTTIHHVATGNDLAIAPLVGWHENVAAHTGQAGFGRLSQERMQAWHG